MKTKYWVAILAVLALVSAVSGWLLLRGGDDAAYAEIRSDGRLLRTVNLAIDQEFTVTASGGGENTVTVRDGKIAVTAASCPDHYCMERGYCSGGAQIVCLPNKLVISFLAETEVDGVVG